MLSILKSLLCVLFLGLPIAAQAQTQAQPQGKSIIVLDASGSMWGQIGGRAKLEIAREALATVLTGLPPATEIGLIAYGHREKGNCSDIELIVPPASGTARTIIKTANAMKFLGKTPLTEAVRLAAGALKSTEAKATVILITDGIETCDADPCALGAELEQSGVDFTAHVVGFGLTEDEGKQVSCLAENTGGQYIEAKDAGSLVEALKSTVAAPEPAPAPAPAPEPAPEPAPKPAILDINFAPKALLAPGVEIPEDNTDVVWEILMKKPDGTAGERVQTEYNEAKAFVEPGTYILRAMLDTLVTEVPLTLAADTLATPEVIFNGARMILTPKAVAGGDVAEGAAVQIQHGPDIYSTNYGVSRFYVPAGETVVTATMDAAKVTETITLTPGQLLEKDIVIGAGLAVIDGYYTQGMLMENTQHAVEIFAAKKALDGSREKFGTDYGPDAQFNLPPGDYIARIGQGAAIAEAAFTVKVGERTDVAVILNAGVLGVTAPGATEITVLAAKKDINGNRTQAAFDYAESGNYTLTEGDYVVQAKQGETTSEAPVKIVAGERTEVTLP